MVYNRDSAMRTTTTIPWERNAKAMIRTGYNANERGFAALRAECYRHSSGNV